MKFSKLSWMILSIGIFIIGAIVLYVLYQQQADEQDELNLSLAAANSALPALISDNAALQSQLDALEADLAEARANLDAVEAELPTDIQSSIYGDLLFEMADNAGLDVKKFKATEPSRRVLDGIIYEATTITMVVDNSLQDILEFISQIEAMFDFNTTTIDSMSIRDLNGDLDNLESIQITLLAYIGVL